MKLKHYIINADDFGKSIATNQGIKIALENGWVNSATIMANMPAFDEACRWAFENNSVGDFGVHLNIVEGSPLTSSILNFRRLCTPAGYLSGKFLSGQNILTSQEKMAIFFELKAQIQACIDNGVIPSHVDSHHHAATSFKIFPIVLRLVKEYKIPAMRLNPNANTKKLNILKRAYIGLYNFTLYYKGLSRATTAGRLIDFNPSWASFYGVTELIVHPVFFRERVVDEESKYEVEALLNNLGDYKLLRSSQIRRPLRPKIL
jgi:predicted glycoside hydrolase/deacetylase ChbG (UPF0249 family)